MEFRFQCPVLFRCPYHYSYYSYHSYHSGHSWYWYWYGHRNRNGHGNRNGHRNGHWNRNSINLWFIYNKKESALSRLLFLFE